MKIRSCVGGGGIRIFLDGELDHHAAKEAMSRIGGLIDVYLPKECTLDLSGLRFMDSSGIAVILKSCKLMRELGGLLFVENAPPQALKVIDASGIERIISIREKVQ